MVREYKLRVRFGAEESHEFTLAIQNEAFLANRVRYQDGPDICFHKLERELAAFTDGMPDAYQSVTDGDLEAYRIAHIPKTKPRRPMSPPSA
jgi:hypothetical protein